MIGPGGPWVDGGSFRSKLKVWARSYRRKPMSSAPRHDPAINAAIALLAERGPMVSLCTNVAASAASNFLGPRGGGMFERV
jgi:hypothetical protein